MPWFRRWLDLPWCLKICIATSSLSQTLSLFHMLRFILRSMSNILSLLNATEKNGTFRSRFQKNQVSSHCILVLSLRPKEPSLSQIWGKPKQSAFNSACSRVSILPGHIFSFLFILFPHENDTFSLFSKVILRRISKERFLKERFRECYSYFQWKSYSLAIRAW